MHLQPAVDDLAQRIGRPVLLEDHAQSVLAYSTQNGPMDNVRRDSILRRHTADEVRSTSAPLASSRPAGRCGYRSPATCCRGCACRSGTGTGCWVSCG
jgi:hypothetical protein